MYYYKIINQKNSSKTKYHLQLPTYNNCLSGEKIHKTQLFKKHKIRKTRKYKVTKQKNYRRVVEPNQQLVSEPKQYQSGPTKPTTLDLLSSYTPPSLNIEVKGETDIAVSNMGPKVTLTFLFLSIISFVSFPHFASIPELYSITMQHLRSFNTIISLSHIPDIFCLLFSFYFYTPQIFHCY